MTKPKAKPAPFVGGHFYTAEMQAWLCGYIPRIAREWSAPAAGRPTTREAAQRLADAQERGSQVWRKKVAA